MQMLRIYGTLHKEVPLTGPCRGLYRHTTRVAPDSFYHPPILPYMTTMSRMRGCLLRTCSGAVRHVTPCQSGNGSVTESKDTLCKIVYPEVGQDASNVKGVVHFLGGAFAGAAPSTLYGRCIKAFTEAGFVVITNAYAVTFRHDECARQLDERFGCALAEVKETLEGDTSDLKVFAVGHSNGALMAAMMSSMPECTNAQYNACILISFNNRQVGEAVPIPLSGLQDLLQSVQRGSDSDVEDRVREAVLSNIRLLNDARIDIKDVETSVVQLGSVLDEVALGLDDFIPSPGENALNIGQGYSVPKTLLMQFKDDDIDQSEILYRVLKKNNSRRSVTFQSVEYGTHLSPLFEGGNVAKLCIDYLESRC